MKYIFISGRIIIGWIVIPVFIAWIGYSHVGPLFRGEFTQHTGSIEVSYISMARFLETTPVWQPRWYLGYPMSLLYTPLVPVFEFVAKVMFGWSYGHSYRILTGFAYVAGLVSLYILGRLLFKSGVSGLIAALIYATLPSVIAFLYGEVAADRFLADVVEPRRFTILVRWGEGPHLVSLIFMPVAAAFYITFLRKGGKWALISGAVMAALTLLTNSIGAWGLAILAFSLTAGEFAEVTAKKSIAEGKNWRTVIARMLLFAGLSAGLSAFWFNPLFLSTFFREGGGALSYWRNQFPWGWIVICTIFILYILITRKFLARFSGLAGAGLFLGVMFYFVNTYYASGYEKLELVPQVLRLTTEVDMALALFVGGIASIFITLARKKSWLVILVSIVMVVLALGATYPRQLDLADELPPYTRPADEVKVDLSKSVEKEVADKLARLVTGHERVLVPGNYGFYLDYFTDIPQLRGALFQSSIHPWPDHIYYQVTNGEDGDISLAWLKIANVGWLVYGGPREIFRDFKVLPEKFADSGLTQVDDIQGDRFYSVPLKNSSLAKIVPAKIKKTPVPKNAIDKEPIFAYVDLLETSPRTATITEKQNGRYEIIAETEADEWVLVQIAHAPGWKAKDQKGRSLEVFRDPLGYILINPKEPGQTVFTLFYTTPWQVWSGWLVSSLTLCLILFIIFRIKQPLFYFPHSVSSPALPEDE